MPGFAGYVSTRRGEHNQIDITRMAAALHHQGGGQRSLRASGDAALAAFDGGMAEKEGRILVLSGLVVPDETLRHRLETLLPGPPPVDGPPTEDGPAPGELTTRLLALYLAGGTAALAGLNGAYAIAVWDGPARTLVLVNDRSGVQPCYYWDAGGGRLAVSTEMKAIAALPDFPREVDPAGLFDLVATGQALGERTLFQAVQALPPASILTYSDGCVTIEPYWEPPLFHSGRTRHASDEVIDQMAELVRAAATRFLSAVPPEGEVCLLVTGGLDSRLLAATVARRNNPLALCASTIGHEQAFDVRFGRQIARAVGLPHALVPASPQYLETYGPECVLRTEGSLNVHAAWILTQSGFLAQQGIRAVMTGVGGETISGRSWLNEQRIPQPHKAITRLFDYHWQAPAAAQLLRPQIARAGQLAGREDAFRTITQARTDDPYARFDYLAYRQWYRHPTGNVLAPDALVLEPFYDNDLLAFAFRQSPVEQIGGRIYQKMIERHFPLVAGVAYTDRAGRLDAFSALAARAGRRLARHVPFLRPVPYGDHPASAIYYNHWLRTASRAYVTTLLNREDLLGDYFVMPRVRRLLDDHMSGRADAFRLIGALVTFALWRELIG